MLLEAVGIRTSLNGALTRPGELSLPKHLGGSKKWTPSTMWILHFARGSTCTSEALLAIL